VAPGFLHFWTTLLRLVTDSVRLIALRLATALGMTVDPEYFMNDAAWALVAQLEEAMNENRKLDQLVLQLLEELSIALNARGGDENIFHTALEGQLGSSPFPPETIVGIVRYVRAQLHFKPKRGGVELDPQTAHVPLKNYEFK
jgi:hypothetical protein